VTSAMAAVALFPQGAILLCERQPEARLPTRPACLPAIGDVRQAPGFIRASRSRSMNCWVEGWPGSCGSHPQAVAGPDALAVMAFPGPLRLAEPLRQTDGASLNAAANEEPRLVEPAARADGGTCPRADRPYPERSQP
jgi:hypothetical protein